MGEKWFFFHCEGYLWGGVFLGSWWPCLGGGAGELWGLGGLGSGACCQASSGVGAVAFK